MGRRRRRPPVDTDNAPLRQLFYERCALEPTLTTSELAHRLGTSAGQVERWLGLRATAPKTDARGRTYAGRVLTAIDVEIAGRLARALGHAPCDLDWC